MKQNTKSFLIVTAFFAIGLPSLIYLVSLLPKPTPEEIEASKVRADSIAVVEAAKPKPDAVFNSAWDESVYQVVNYLERTLNDPGSYESIEWGKVEKYHDPNDSTSHVFVVKHKYRAKNSFGGYVTASNEFRFNSEGNIIQVN